MLEVLQRKPRLLDAEWFIIAEQFGENTLVKGTCCDSVWAALIAVQQQWLGY